MAFDMKSPGEASGADSGPFERVLRDSIDEALTEVFGDKIAETVRYYVNTDIAVKSMDEYEAELNRVFRDGSVYLLSVIKTKLGSKLGMENYNSDISSFVLLAKQVHARD